MAWTSFSSSSRPPNSQSFCSLPLNGDVKRWLSLVYLLIYLIWSMSVHDAHMEIEDNLWDSVLSFHHRELNSGLAASTFTYWALLPSLSILLFFPKHCIWFKSRPLTWFKDGLGYPAWLRRMSSAMHITPLLFSDGCTVADGFCDHSSCLRRRWLLNYHDGILDPYNEHSGRQQTPAVFITDSAANQYSRLLSRTALHRLSRPVRMVTLWLQVTRGCLVSVSPDRSFSEWDEVLTSISSELPP